MKTEVTSPQKDSGNNEANRTLKLQIGVKNILQLHPNFRELMSTFTGVGVSMKSPCTKV